MISLTKYLQSKNIFLLLTFISGICGISYELMYFRFLGNIFGDFYLTAIALLTSFIFSMAVGNFLSVYFQRHLWLIEGLLGVISLIFFFLYKFSGGYTSPLLQSFIFESQLENFIIIFILVFTPALLVGMSVPLFSFRISHLFKKNYKTIYLIYNLGASFSVLFLGVFLFSLVPLSYVFCVFGFINICLSIILYYFFSSEKKIFPVKFSQFKFFSFRIGGEVFSLSFLSAIFQVLFLQLFFFAFGVTHISFTLVLATILAFISLGTLFALKVNNRNTYYVSFLGTLVLFGIFFMPIISKLFLLGYSSKILSEGFLILIFGAPFIFFGGSIPFFIHKNEEVPFALSISSFGNVLGYLCAYFFLIPYFSFLSILISIISGVILIFFLFFLTRKNFKIACIYFSFLFFIPFFWNENILFSAPQLYYRESKNYQEFKNYENIKNINKFFGKDGLVAEINFKNGEQNLFILGNSSQKITRSQDIFQALIPSLFAKKRENALIMGFGSGATAIAALPLYNKVDVVEISPSVIDYIKKSGKNDSFFKSKKTSIFIKDAFVYLNASKKKYDFIVNSIYLPKNNSSSKLYSQEFIKIVADHMNPYGIYGTHIVGDIKSQGAQIYLATLHSVFPYCAITKMKNSLFYELICSHVPIKTNFFEEDIILRLLSDHKIPFSKEENLINTNIFLDKRLYLDSPKINNLDFPILEYSL